MAPLDDEFEFVAASVDRAIRRQRDVFVEALLADGVRHAGLLRHLVLAYDAVAKHLSVRRKDFAAAPDDTVKESAILELRELVWDVRDMQSNLPWLDAARQSFLDLGTAYWVERIARRTVDANAEVTVMAADEGSYATQTNPWKPLIDNLGSGIPAGEPPVVVVRIPRRERRSGLLHPLIVHELGHAIDSQHNVVSGVWQTISGREPFKRRFTSTVSDYASAIGSSTQDAALYVGARLIKWLAEAFCDAVATTRLGPTYLYSFLVEVAAGTMDYAGKAHPPARERIALLVEQLDAAGWGPRMAAADGVLDSWVRAQLVGRPVYTGVDGFLVWATKYSRAVVRRRARAALSGAVLRPTAAGLSDAELLLTQGVPPAQELSGTPIAPEVVILACWFSALTAAGSGPGALVRAPDAQQLAQVLPAALQLSAVVAAWEAP